MQIFFGIIFAIIFGFINYKIIISDQKTKKIPNKNLLQLLILLPFWYIFLYFFNLDINFLNFFIQIFVSLLVSFLLFNFGIWRAGDAKYLLVLSLFIPYIGIIPFIGNLGLFTIFYLFLYFLWFFIGKSIFYKGYLKNLFANIKIDLTEKWKVYKNNKGGKSFFIILKWLTIFLIVFVSLRLFRIYLFLEFFENFGGNNTFIEIFQKYHYYLIFASIAFFIGLYYIGKKFINFLKIFLAEKLKLNLEFVGNIFIGILFVALSGFIFLEFQKNPDEILGYLIRIFTIYIAIYIFAKIIFYGYKLSFGTAEEYFIDIKNLKVGDIVDKKYLLELGAIKSSYEITRLKMVSKTDSGVEFIRKMKNPLDIESIRGLHIILEEINLFHLENKTSNFKEINQIKLLKTFSFGIFIFTGFIITLFFQNHIIKFLIYIVHKLLIY